MYAVGRFILGFGSAAVYVVSFVLMMESVGPGLRGFGGCMIQITTSAGFALLAPISYAFRNHVTFQLVAMLPIAVFFFMFLYVEETLRWLIVKGRYKNAEKVLHKICRVNRKQTPPDSLKLSNIKTNESKANCVAVLATPRLRLRTIIIHIIFMVASLLWYSLSLNTGFLDGDIFVNTAVSASMEIPSVIITIFIIEIKFIGRRFGTVGSLLLSSTALVVAIPMVLLGNTSAVAGLEIVAKSTATSTYTIMFIYAAEIFPTEVRNVAMASATAASMVSAILAPYIGAPMAEVWPALPHVILGTLSGIAGLLSVLLPETVGEPLSDTVKQADMFTGRKSSSCCSRRDDVSEVINDVIVTKNDSLSASVKEQTNF